MTDRDRTELEDEILDLALQWIDARYAVEEALHQTGIHPQD